MAKEVDLLDDLDLDDLDDYDFGGDDEFSEFDPPPDNRSPTTKVLSSVVDKFNPLKNGKAIASIILKNTLPSSYTDAYNLASDLSRTAVEVFDDTKRQTEPLVNAINYQGKRLLPMVANFLPTKLAARVKAFGKEDPEEEDDYYNSGDDDTESSGGVTSNIDATLKTIFGAERLDRDLREKKQRVLDNQSTEIQSRQFVASSNIVSHIAKSVSRLVGYQDNITDKYYRETLKLQYMHYYATRDILGLTKDTSFSMLNMLGEIVKNTGLPNEVKATTSEIFATKSKEMLVGKGQEFIRERLSNLPNRIIEGVKTNVGDFVDTMTGAVDMAGSMIGGGDEFDEDQYVTAGGNAGDLAVNSLGSRAARFIKRKAPGVLQTLVPGAQEAATGFGDTLKSYTTDWRARLNELIQDDGGEDPFEWVRDIVGNITGNSEVINHNLRSEATTPVSWDVLSRRTLIEVIPGYFSRLLQETVNLGNILSGREIETDRTIYSPVHEDFVKQSEATHKAASALRNTFGTGLKENVDAIINYLDPDGTELLPEERIQLSKQFILDSNDGKYFNVKRYADEDSYTIPNGDKYAEMFRDRFHMSETWNDRTMSMDRAIAGNEYSTVEDKLAAKKANADLMENFGRLRDNVGNYQEVTNSYYATGDLGTIKGTGAVTADGKINYDHKSQRIEDILRATDISEFVVGPAYAAPSTVPNIFGGADIRLPNVNGGYTGGPTPPGPIPPMPSDGLPPTPPMPPVPDEPTVEDDGVSDSITVDPPSNAGKRRRRRKAKETVVVEEEPLVEDLSSDTGKPKKTRKPRKPKNATAVTEEVQIDDLPSNVGKPKRTRKPKKASVTTDHPIEESITPETTRDSAPPIPASEIPSVKRKSRIGRSLDFLGLTEDEVVPVDPNRVIRVGEMLAGNKPKKKKGIWNPFRELADYADSKVQDETSVEIVPDVPAVAEEVVVVEDLPSNAGKPKKIRKPRKVKPTITETEETLVEDLPSSAGKPKRVRKPKTTTVVAETVIIEPTQSVDAVELVSEATITSTAESVAKAIRDVLPQTIIAGVQHVLDQPLVANAFNVAQSYADQVKANRHIQDASKTVTDTLANNATVTNIKDKISNVTGKVPFKSLYAAVTKPKVPVEDKPSLGVKGITGRYNEPHRYVLNNATQQVGEQSVSDTIHSVVDVISGQVQERLEDVSKYIKNPKYVQYIRGMAQRHNAFVGPMPEQPNADQAQPSTEGIVSKIKGDISGKILSVLDNAINKKSEEAGENAEATDEPVTEEQKQQSKADRRKRYKDKRDEYINSLPFGTRVATKTGMLIGKAGLGVVSHMIKAMPTRINRLLKIADFATKIIMLPFKLMGKFANHVNNLYKGGKKLIHQGLEKLKGLGKFIPEPIKDMFGKATSLLGKVTKPIDTLLKKGKNKVYRKRSPVEILEERSRLIRSILGTAGDAINPVMGFGKGLVSPLVDTVRPDVEDAIDKVKEKAEPIIKSAADTAHTVADKAKKGYDTASDYVSKKAEELHPETGKKDKTFAEHLWESSNINFTNPSSITDSLKGGLSDAALKYARQRAERGIYNTASKVHKTTASVVDAIDPEIKGAVVDKFTSVKDRVKGFFNRPPVEPTQPIDETEGKVKKVFTRETPEPINDQPAQEENATPKVGGFVEGVKKKIKSAISNVEMPPMGIGLALAAKYTKPRPEEVLEGEELTDTDIPKDKDTVAGFKISELVTTIMDRINEYRTKDKDDEESPVNKLTATVEGIFEFLKKLNPETDSETANSERAYGVGDLIKRRNGKKDKVKTDATDKDGKDEKDKSTDDEGGGFLEMLAGGFGIKAAFDAVVGIVSKVKGVFTSIYNMGGKLGKVFEFITKVGTKLASGLGWITRLLGIGSAVAETGAVAGTVAAAGTAAAGAATAGTVAAGGTLAGISATLSTGATVAAGMLTTAATATAAAGSSFMGLVGSGAVGAALLTNPIGWAILAAGTAYAGYKAYQYFTKDDAKLKPLALLRFLQYGIPVSNEHAILSVKLLERTIEDSFEVGSNNIPVLKMSLQEIWEEVCEDFGSEEDNIQNYQNFSYWFNNRFLPVYTKHTLLGIAFGKIALEDLDDDIDAEDKQSFVVKAQFTEQSERGGIAPMRVTTSPWADIPLEDNSVHISTLSEQIKSDSKRGNNTDVDNLSFIKPVKPEKEEEAAKPKKRVTPLHQQEMDEAAKDDNDPTKNKPEPNFFQKTASWMQEKMTGAKDSFFAGAQSLGKQIGQGIYGVGEKVGNVYQAGKDLLVGDKGNAKLMMKILMERGWSKAQAAGLAANVAAESGFKIGAIGDGTEAYGIAQWHPDRQLNFKRVMGKDIRGSRFEEQVAFLDWELTHTDYNNGINKKAGDLLRTIDDPARAAAIVEQKYERSKLGGQGGVQPERVNAARGYFAFSDDEIQGAGSTSSQITEHVKDIAGFGDKNYKGVPLSDLPIKSAEATAGGKAQDGTMDLARATMGAFGNEINRFTAFNDAFHQNKAPTSMHTKGLAFDLTTKKSIDSEKVAGGIKTIAAKAGVDVNVINEYIHPSKKSSGGHVHTNFRSAADAAKFANVFASSNTEDADDKEGGSNTAPTAPVDPMSPTAMVDSAPPSSPAVTAPVPTVPPSQASPATLAQTAIAQAGPEGAVNAAESVPTSAPISTPTAGGTKVVTPAMVATAEGVTTAPSPVLKSTPPRTSPLTSKDVAPAPTITDETGVINVTPSASSILAPAPQTVSPVNVDLTAIGKLTGKIAQEAGGQRDEQTKLLLDIKKLLETIANGQSGSLSPVNNQSSDASKDMQYAANIAAKGKPIVKEAAVSHSRRY